MRNINITPRRCVYARSHKVYYQENVSVDSVCVCVCVYRPGTFERSGLAPIFSLLYGASSPWQFFFVPILFLLLFISFYFFFFFFHSVPSTHTHSEKEQFPERKQIAKQEQRRCRCLYFLFTRARRNISLSTSSSLENKDADKKKKKKKNVPQQILGSVCDLRVETADWRAFDDGLV